MIKAKSLYHLILYSITFIIILTSSFTFIIIDNAFDEFQEKIKIIRDNFTSKNKDLIRHDIEKTKQFITFYHNKHKNIKTEEEIKNEVLNAIELMRNKNDINDYSFIYEFSGTSIYYPISSNNIGKNLLEITDPSGKKVIKELVKISKEPLGGYVKYIWYKPQIKKDALKISYALSYDPWGWTLGKGVYLDEIEKIVKEKQYEYDEKISNYILQILSLTIMLVLYSMFIYKNATILIVNDVKEIGKYFKEAKKSDTPINQNRLIFGEFKVIANYANAAMNDIKVKTHMLEDVNIHLEETVESKTKELKHLIDAQKEFLKNSVHEINTPLSIIQTNIDLLKRKVPNNRYVTNIESGAKIIQSIYKDLSFLIKKDRVEYEKEILSISQILSQRIDFFDEIAKSNSLLFITSIEEDVYLRFNKTLLERIIDNNLSNAIKYSHSNSTIYVELSYKDTNDIEFSVRTNSKKIADSDKIFNDFYRENNARGGFGIGLRIVKEISDKNNVIIKLESNDEFTKFTYRFKIDENITT